MVHRKNRDLKAELVEAQLAAQQWEDRYLQALQRAQDAEQELSKLRASMNLNDSDEFQVTW